MAIPILQNWMTYFQDHHEGLGSSYERIILNKLLLKLKHRYKLDTVLEAPVFGFTGITGLNSLVLNKSGCKVTLLDHDQDRINQIRLIHSELQVDIQSEFVDNYIKLPYIDNEFDMCWNFSALWFVQNITDFLSELSRVSKKIILICVPNQYGFGYKWQKAHADIPQDITFNKAFINPGLIKSELQKLNWTLISEDYIDCPLWPDIGMNKEKFLGKYLSKLNIQTTQDRPSEPVSIMGYYKGEDPGFADRMMKYAFLEINAPDFFKKMWSHHRWMLFEPALKHE